MRSRRINLDVNDAEWAALAQLAEAAQLSLRSYIRETALAPRARAAQAPPSAADFDAAALLTRIAEDLARLGEAAATGIVTGIAPELLRDLCDAAHLLGLRLIQAAPRAR